MAMINRFVRWFESRRVSVQLFPAQQGWLSRWRASRRKWFLAELQRIWPIKVEPRQIPLAKIEPEIPIWKPRITSEWHGNANGPSVSGFGLVDTTRKYGSC